MERIKSFEEGGAVVGDILTRGKTKRNIKIGVLTCGYFEYWRMFPRDARKRHVGFQSVR